MKRLFAFSMLALLVAGCRTPRTGYVPTDESGVMTVFEDGGVAAEAPGEAVFLYGGFADGVYHF